MEDPGANINPLAIATPGSAAPTPAVVRRRTSQKLVFRMPQRLADGDVTVTDLRTSVFVPSLCSAFSLKSAVGYSARFPFTLNFFDTVGPDESNRLYDDFCLDKETYVGSAEIRLGRLLLSIQSSLSVRMLNLCGNGAGGNWA